MARRISSFLSLNLLDSSSNSSAAHDSKPADKASNSLSTPSSIPRTSKSTTNLAVQAQFQTLSPASKSTTNLSRESNAPQASPDPRRASYLSPAASPLSIGTTDASLSTGRRPRSAPDSPKSLVPDLTSGGDKKASKRRSWLGGSPSIPSQPVILQSSRKQHATWIAGHSESVPYNTQCLTHADRVSELWMDSGDTLVYLFPKDSGLGPSFKIHSSTFAASTHLTRQAYGHLYSKKRITSADSTNSSLEAAAQQTIVITPPLSPKITAVDTSSTTSSKATRTTTTSEEGTTSTTNLHIPVNLSQSAARGNPSREDVESLISIRNLFAFLHGQSLVATEQRQNMFSIFLDIAKSLASFDFSNLDGSTFGEVAASSFDRYVDELGLLDVRHSREKNIEALVLGERMRSVMLYNEAFTHAVGRYADIQEVTKLAAPQAKFNLLGSITRSRLERASIDLYKREEKLKIRLAAFDFPSIFDGVLNSKMAEERKIIRFATWKDSFLTVRKHVLSYYKHKFGSWPPKASSKKNDLEVGGLSRLVLKTLYRDFAELYDLLVDRSSLTTRSTDRRLSVPSDEVDDPVVRILRRVFEEYDHSVPPVQPAIPYDIPNLPTLSTTRPGYGSDPVKDAHGRVTPLERSEAAQIIGSSYNADVLGRKKSPFIQSMLEFESKASRNATITDIADIRASVWMFLYAVIQALPMLVIDAPGLRFHEGVEYFLCVPPRSGVPWAQGDTSGRSRKHWYGVSGGQGIVSLPSDLVEHGVEGVFHRSHCWLMANQWSVNTTAGSEEAQIRDGANTLHPQPPHTSQPPSPRGSPVFSSTLTRSRSPSLTPNATSHHQRQSVLNLGLEALPLPIGVSPDAPSSSSNKASHQRKVSVQDPTKTFDAIFSNMHADAEEKPRGKKAK